MEAKELKIGNLVRSKANGISKVEQIGSSINSEYVGGRSLEGNYWENSYLPIPLTEEWLLNFGFEVYRVGFKENEYTLKDRLIVIINGLFCDYGTSVIIKHVHQLQNLYFALTGEELTLSK